MQAAAITAGASKAASGEKQVDFQFLENSAGSFEDREGTQCRAGGGAKGQYVPNKAGSDRVFFLGRFRINCCRMDAVQLNVPIISSVSIKNILADDWIEVTGEIRYRQDAKGVYHTQLMVHHKDDVAP